eukprot:CAMPEP_0168314252 /NCGR_PEP_ID=MMETSP0210-20121227/6928_1 /TAXON_ID=40633 /ORGANISM="Condylostoma magnum, Strain COL2" /LENGTH=31 /DNA_ID= /DNA_START= /DNA_END= /DNA_ORIENTATION=
MSIQNMDTPLNDVDEYQYFKDKLRWMHQNKA